ncbi:rhodanese-like domain-containing protein [Periweissella cryptocerci]|nr:rhodanese-like domain-containing protein [Periweissella cryptocerci]
MINYILYFIILVFAIYMLYWFIQGRRSAKFVKQEEYAEMIRGGQLVDLREKDDYKAGHIMGARNLPYSVFWQSYNALRTDKPVLLYDTTTRFSTRAANRLRTKGYKEIYILKGGYTRWDGKKSSK